MHVRHAIPIIAAALLLAAGCGGAESTKKQVTVSAANRVEGCLTQQPDATKADCQGWEKDGLLGDDGTHKGHENM